MKNYKALREAAQVKLEKWIKTNPSLVDVDKNNKFVVSRGEIIDDISIDMRIKCNNKQKLIVLMYEEPLSKLDKAKLFVACFLENTDLIEVDAKWLIDQCTCSMGKELKILNYEIL
jgi:hypothetical protein